MVGLGNQAKDSRNRQSQVVSVFWQLVVADCPVQETFFERQGIWTRPALSTIDAPAADGLPVDSCRLM